MSSKSPFKIEKTSQESLFSNSSRKSKKSSLSVKLSAKASEYRKNTKPLMEKRRRERINRSLEELKDIILTHTNHNPIRNHKLEKADILELTVKHLKNLQKQKLLVTSTEDPNIKNKYKLGYYECVQECLKFLTSDSYRAENFSNEIDDSIRQRLIINLYKQYQSIHTDNFSNMAPEEYSTYMNEQRDMIKNESSPDFLQESLVNFSSCSELNISKDSEVNNNEKPESLEDSKVWRPW